MQSSAVRWNGRDAHAVYCVPGTSLTADLLVDKHSANTSVDGGAGFVEKRHGHRRNAVSQPTSANHSIESGFFKNLKQPMIICDNWVPVEVNSVASALIARDESNKTHDW